MYLVYVSVDEGLRVLPLNGDGLVARHAFAFANLIFKE